MINGNGPICGGRHESQMEGYTEEIKSKNIKSFTYIGPDFSLNAKKENEKLLIFCSGGGKYNKRDGSLFSIKYETNDFNILNLLQEVIDKNNETRGNGHCVQVDGLPAGIGDLLNIEYESGEKIYKTSNQSLTVNPDSATKFYNIFHEFVLKDGYDFNTAGSNVKLFDDADEEYLQGTWKGTHFGDEIEVTFNKNKVTISIAGNITDENVEYTVFEGSVVRNILKDETKPPSSYHDYEFFEGISTFSKMNWFTITAYFIKESSSSCSLHNFDKEKPEDEE